MSYYEARYILKYDGNEINSLLVSEDKITLLEATKSYDKITLLGDPGIGKSTELKNLFDCLWESKKETGIIPFLISLKNYLNGKTIEDLIDNENWINFPQVILILDGLDEISNIQEFISELEFFISKNKKRNLKYVISCRTNIYNKYLADIKGFQTFILSSLTLNQTESILKNKFNLDGLDKHLFENIDTPFFLNLFAESYIKENSTPYSSAKIWEIFIDKTLTSHKSKIIKRSILNKPKTIKLLTLISLVNELMQKNSITNDELYSIVGDEYNVVIENPFLIEKTGDDYWYFVHRQIQEYFVAKSLLSKSFDKILSFIKIEGLDSIHPSLHNSTTFLLDLMDTNSASYKRLIDWIRLHQIELLFKADSNRIDPETRIEVFQDYFEKECIKKTLWISTNITFDVFEMSSFGDFPKNFKYLIDIITNHKNYHFRVLYSALNLLQYFSNSSFDTAYFKKYLLERLKSSDFPTSGKSEIIRIIQKYKFIDDDRDYLKTIFSVFKNETHKQLNNSLISLIHDLDNVDEFEVFILEEFLMANGYKSRIEEDEVIRGNKYLVNKLILKLNGSSCYLKLLSYYLNEDLTIRFYDDFESKLTNKVISFIIEDKLPIISILKFINDDLNFHTHRQFLTRLIKESGSENKALFYLLENKELDKIRFFISSLVSFDNVEKLVEILLAKKLETQEIEYFRNNIGNIGESYSRKLAVSFNDLMMNKGIQFVEPVFTEEKAKEYVEKFKNQIQNNFDILFNQKSLLNEIKILFEKNNNEISGDDISKIRRNWYDKNGHSNIIDTSISIVDNLLFSKNNTTTSYKEIEDLIVKNDFITVNKIKQIIEQYIRNNRQFSISLDQKEHIKKWSLDKAENMDFDKMLIINPNRSFRYQTNYKIFESIFYFQKLIKFDLPKSFLLDSIEYFEFDKSGELDESFSYLYNLINDKASFDSKIVSNLNSKELLGLSKSKHIEYALENKLHKSYKSIRNHFLDGDSIYNERRKLEKYVKCTNDFEILMELCIDDENYIYWAAISIMIQNNINIKFCTEKAIDYLNSDKKRYPIDALNVLFTTNDNRAINYTLKYIENNFSSSILDLKYTDYYNLNVLNELEKLYDLIYISKHDKFESSNYRRFFQKIILNLSKSDEGFTYIQAFLAKKKDDLLDSKDDLFYINLLIDDSINSHISHKSIPFNFEDAKSKAMEFLS